jgi:hypothetical protein
MDVVVVKIAADGTALWARRFTGVWNGSDWPADMTIDAQGNVVVGDAQGPGGTSDWFVVKYGPDGGESWSHGWDGPAGKTDHALAVALDRAGNACVTGVFDQANDTTGDVNTVKLSPDGVVVWEHTWDGPGGIQDAPRDIAVDSAGSAYIVGDTGSALPRTAFQLTYRSDGQLSEARNWWPVESFSLELTNVLPAPDGGAYVAGTATSGPADDAGSDHFLARVRPAGGLRWRTRRAVGADSLWALCRDRFGNVYATGMHVSAGGHPKVLAVKYSSKGKPRWSTTWSPSGALAGEDTTGQSICWGSSGLFVGAGALPGAYDSWGALLKYRP